MKEVIVKKRLLIKYGGNAIGDNNTLMDFAQAIASIRQMNTEIVIVHGGGPQINYWLERTGVESHFVDGQRHTDAQALTVVEMTLCGQVNKAIVRALRAVGISAVGISGEDGHLLMASAKPALGAVGEIVKTHPALIENLLANDYLPVIAPLGCDEKANVLNINADYAAAHIAGALKADECLFMTNVSGLLDAEKKRINHADRQLIQNLIASGVINGGMIPKVDCALTALERGVKSTRIINGLKMTTLLESQSGSDVGTSICQ